MDNRLEPADREGAAHRATSTSQGCAVFVVGAIAAGVVSGLHANSGAHTTTVAAALGYRLILHQTGLRLRAWVVVVSVVPFVVFVGGVAVGADWETWH